MIPLPYKFLFINLNSSFKMKKLLFTLCLGVALYSCTKDEIETPPVNYTPKREVIEATTTTDTTIVNPDSIGKDEIKDGDV